MEVYYGIKSSKFSYATSTWTSEGSTKALVCYHLSGISSSKEVALSQAFREGEERERKSGGGGGCDSRATGGRRTIGGVGVLWFRSAFL
ncbi:hypothetical protein L1987_24418 [Smallanthus sonchifolius]|uniref:Uncharacterized protein n=1 Tax=Smallanthus sonchifolius TaxID=185202 RepID=A0ACB9IN18_9ASTR|nr:hypothetical protein L1987_24418 [Smallanthus sonchifolius]